MKKSNRILIALFAIIVTLMIGYALFSETITVTGSASASGDWSITTTCQTGVSPEIRTALINYAGEDYLAYYPENGYENDYCEVNGNNVNFGVELKYPTASRYFTVTVTNTGSIDAVVDTSIFGKLYNNQTVKVYDSKTDSLYNTYSSGNSNWYDEVVHQYAHFTDPRSYDDASLFVVGKNKDNNYSFYLYENEEPEDMIDKGMFVKDLNTQKEYLRIKSGESLTFMSHAMWNFHATDSLKYSVVNASLEIPFEQINSNMVDVIE